MFTRRRLITSLATTLFVAPAIVRASSLMAIKPFRDDIIEYILIEYIPIHGRDQFGQPQTQRISIPNWDVRRPVVLHSVDEFGSITSVTFT